jgi:glycosyltransferase involved in cell wall biosynthesis
MTNEQKHITVCVCTYKRPQLLKRLVEKLCDQLTDGLFTYSILICDNDASRSAEAAVSAFAAVSPVAVRYCSEARQNIALARNKAVENATGDFIAFIDDDEFPIKEWLLTLFKAINEYNVDGVLGPVKPYFEDNAPRWVVKGKFYERPTYPTGFVIDWHKGRTGNVLLRMQLREQGEQLFRSEFRAGSDQDAFRRLIEKGHVFIWCNEAVAYEVVPPVRWKRRFMLKRAFLRGATARLHPTMVAVGIVTSVIAVPVYAVALPFGLLLGHHRFMLFLVKLCDHLGKLLAFVGINPIHEQYITD